MKQCCKYWKNSFDKEFCTVEGPWASFKYEPLLCPNCGTKLEDCPIGLPDVLPGDNRNAIDIIHRYLKRERKSLIDSVESLKR